MATVGTSSVVEPLDAKKRWVFKTTQNDDLIAAALVKHMVKTGVKTVGFIGFKDPYGENWHKVFSGHGRKGGDQDRRDRVLPAHRSERHRAGAQADRREARRGAGRRRRRPRRAAADHAARPGLQGHDLPDARCRDRRLHPPRQGEGRRHDPRRRADAGDRRDSRFESDQEGGAELHRRLRKAVRAEAGDVRRQHVGLRAHPAARDSGRAEGRQAGHRGLSQRRCATRSRSEREIVGCQGVFNMSPTNHNGMDERARVLVTVVHDGKFRLLRNE